MTPFDFISIHAPSRFADNEEQSVIDLLVKPAEQGLPIVVHPDVIFHPMKWAALGANLLIENMDKRKPVARSIGELEGFFEALPSARFCFDVGHARQVDPTMTEASLLLSAFGDSLAEVHMSEVNTASRHDPMSFSAVSAFANVLRAISESVPIILEPLIDQGKATSKRSCSVPPRFLPRLPHSRNQNLPQGKFLHMVTGAIWGNGQFPRGRGDHE